MLILEMTLECVIPSLNIRTQGTAGSRRKAEQEAANLAIQQVDIK